MLELPRLLFERALLPFHPLEPPPKPPLEPRFELLGEFRLPIRSALLRLPAAGALLRFATPALLRSDSPPCWDICRWAPCCRFETEAPRVVPP